jgi:hypothetical protein
LGRRAQLSPGAGGGGSGRFGPRSGRRALAAICLAWELGSDECRDEEQEVEVDAVDGDGEPLRVRRLPGWARDRIAATRRPPAVRSPMRERGKFPRLCRLPVLPLDPRPDNGAVGGFGCLCFYRTRPV